MENASKAILIGAGLLLAVLVLSIGAYVYFSYSRVSNSYNLKQQAQDIEKFNSKFLAFSERKDITAQDIISLKNYIEEYNEKNDPDITILVYNGNKLIINAIGKLYNTNSVEISKTDFLKQNSFDRD